MTKTKEKVVLGLRATREQRAWMNAAAESRNMSLQEYFEQIMQAQADSPFLRPDEIVVTVPADMAPAVRLLLSIRARRDEAAWRMISGAIRSLAEMLSKEDSSVNIPTAGQTK